MTNWRGPQTKSGHHQRHGVSESEPCGQHRSCKRSSILIKVFCSQQHPLNYNKTNLKRPWHLSLVLVFILCPIFSCHGKRVSLNGWRAGEFTGRLKTLLWLVPVKETLFWNVGKLRVARPGCCPTPLSWWPLGLRTSAGHPSWFCPLLCPLLCSMLCSLFCSLLVGYSWFSYFRISQPLLPRNSTCPTVAGFVWKICLLLFRNHSPTYRWCWDLNDVTLS